MVEKAHTAAGHESSIWPHMLEPLRHVGEKIADFFAPAADASTSEVAYEINVELPGVKANDVNVELHDNLLTVKGEKHLERERSGKSYYFSERRFGSFHRSFRLPGDSSPADIDAAFKDGVLTIRVAKKEKASPAATRIPVKTE